MSGNYEVWLGDASGQRICLLDRLVSLEVGKTANYASAWAVWLPGDFDIDLLRKDYWVEFWRSAGDGYPLKWVNLGQIRRFRFEQDADGMDKIRIGGPDVNDILKSRIVAYAAGSSQAEKTDQADDMMKTIVYQNLGSSAGAGRDLTGLSLSVGPYVGLGPTVTKAFSYRNVLAVLQEIAESAKQVGTETFFEIHPVALSTGKIGFVFETMIEQPGFDRTGEVFFGSTWGNLAEPVLDEDYSDEATYAYAGGQGQGDARVIVEVEDAVRSGSSVWGRREVFVDTRDTQDANIMTGRAQTELSAMRGKVLFSGKLLDTPECRYGIEWDYGDRVTCEYRGKQFDGVIRAVRVVVAADGTETVEAKVESSG